MDLRRFGVPVLIFGLTLLPFLSGLDGQFLNWDDDENFLKNPGFRGLGWTQLRWMLTSTVTGHWIPLTWLTLGFNYTVGGMDPWGYRLGNVLLHGANSVLCYFIARRLLAAGKAVSPSPSALTIGAAVAALVFSVHPLRTESVLWATERRDVQSCFFFLLASLGYLRAVFEAEDGRPARKWLRLSWAAFVCAVLSKASTVMLPLALLLLDVYPLRRMAYGWRRLVQEKVPYLALGATVGVVAWIAVRREVLVSQLGEYGLMARVSMAAYSFVFYPWKWLWPAGLSPLHEVPQRVDPLDPRFLVPLVTVPLVTAALIALRRVWPAVLAAWTYSIVMVLPLSGVLHMGPPLVHDRWSYLSGLGFAMLAGAGTAAAWEACRRARYAPLAGGLVIGGVAVVLAALGAATRAQGAIWHDSRTLWSRAVEVEPGCGVCHNNLGVAILQSGARDPATLELAERHFRAALAIRSDRPEWRDNLGSLLGQTKRYGEAEAQFRELARLTPGSAVGPARLGALLFETGRYADAVPLLREALRIQPGFPGAAPVLALALNNQAVLLARDHRFADATVLLEDVVTLQPDNADALVNLGQLFIVQGRSIRAVGPLEEAIRLRPDSVPALFWLARAYLAAGDRGHAQPVLDRLRLLDPKAAAKASQAP